MGEVYFIRHGQASFGAANYDNLSELGHQQSDWLGAHLAQDNRPFDRIISGDLTRHKQTLAGILKHVDHEDFSEDPRLNEMSYFVMERAYAAQTGASMPNTPRELEKYFTKVMAAWEKGLIQNEPESYQDFSDRIITAFQDAAEHGKRVLIVSSGGPVAILMRHVLALNISAMTDIILGTHNASITRFSVFPDSVRLNQFNAVPHLDLPDRQHALTLL